MSVSPASVAIAFNNTVAWESGGLVNDRMGTYPALVAWARDSGLFRVEEAAAIRRREAAKPWRTAAVLAQVRELRAISHQILAALSRRDLPGEIALRAFNQALGLGTPRLGLEARGGRLGWAHPGETGPEAILHRVAWNIALFVTSPELERLGMCANAECGWLFLDTTKNRSRRWCSMAECGSRAKARRHYARKKKAGRGGRAGGASTPRTARRRPRGERGLRTLPRERESRERAPEPPEVS
ncbi:MAG TPA: CGNR zinc finger domain-containing protein [Gemmatimonadales bacterium]|jgi:predicted RNA-binding Zn ribbon-like protein|nr:CGNR zinc finger domain-containing protein [Gemmatimonadales bacterium]